MNARRVVGKIGIPVILSGVFFICSSFSGSAAKSGYQYNVVPDTPEWESYNNHAELVQALQIPQDTLNQFDTEELLTVVLDYPLFHDMYYYDNYQLGFETMSSHFNGIQELFKKDDAAGRLLKMYKKIVNEQNDSNRDMISNMEAILAQPRMQEQFTTLEREALSEIISKKNSEKDGFSSSYKTNTYNRCLEGQKNLEMNDTVN